MNLVRGYLLADSDGAVFRREAFCLHIPGRAPGDASPTGRLVTLGIRPELLRLTPPEKASLVGRVVLLEPRGPEVVLTVMVGPVALKAVAPQDSSPSENDAVGLDVDPKSLVFFCGNTNRRIDIFAAEGACS